MSAQRRTWFNLTTSNNSLLVISLISDDLMNDGQSRGFYANISTYYGHRMYFCSKSPDKGTVEDDSICGSFYYRAFHPNESAIFNGKGYNFLIVEPLDVTEKA